LGGGGGGDGLIRTNAVRDVCPPHTRPHHFKSFGGGQAYRIYASVSCSISLTWKRRKNLPRLPRRECCIHAPLFQDDGQRRRGAWPERIHDQDYRNQICSHHTSYTLLAICVVVTVYNIIVDKIIKDLNVRSLWRGGVGGERREVY